MKFKNEHLQSMNNIGYDYDQIRENIGAEPINPALHIMYQFVFALVLSTVCVLCYYYHTSGGDWKKVFDSKPSASSG